jgi:glucan endo-1,3-beta-D-glucosidase
MPSPSKILGVAAAATGASAAFQGFNYGATFADGRLRVESDFESMFEAAQGLAGTDGAFTSARLYTMIQGNTDNEPISAIPAAIKTKTSILFGLWASAGQANFNNELAALQKTIDQYCDQLDGLIAGISIGSEDLYRDSPIGQKAGENPGAGPKVLVNYIEEVRKVIKGTCMSDAKLGHVDTWTAFVNETNKPVIEALDWIGMDAYPYFEDTKPNSIEEAKGLFDAALGNTKGAAGGAEVWITETGYPTKGKTSGDAVANTRNARTYWEEVGCPLFGQTNTWWYTLQDSNSDGPITDETPSFGVVGDDLSKPKYNLSCKGVKPKPASSSSSAESEATTSAKSGNGDKEAKETVESAVESATESAAAESTAEATTEAAAETSTDAAAETSTEAAAETPVNTPSGLTTVSSAEPTPTSSHGGSGSGSDNSGSDNSEGGASTTTGDNEPSQVPTDAGVQLKGSFGAVVVALALTFFAL